MAKWKWLWATGQKEKECYGKGRNTNFLPGNSRCNFFPNNSTSKQGVKEDNGKTQQEAKVRQRVPWMGWAGHSPSCRAALWALISISAFCFCFHPHPQAQLAGTGSTPEQWLFPPWGQHKMLPGHKQGQVQPPGWVMLPAAGTASRSLQGWCCSKAGKGRAATHISQPPLSLCFEKWQWIRTKPQLQKIMGFNLVCAVKLY